MKYLVIAVVGLLTAVIMVRALESDNSPQIVSVAAPPQNASEIEQLLWETTQARDELAALLEEERKQYQKLSDEVVDLIAQLESKLEEPILYSGLVEQPGVIRSAQQDSIRDQVRGGRGVELSVEKLLDSGFSEYEAERILELEAEGRERIAEAVADPEARDRDTLREIAQETTTQLRTELGDYGYENYLEASGRSTTVGVRGVDPESPGAAAGILEGDQIVSYGGERVFSITDLQSQTSSGTEGQSVVVEILRDDQPVTIVLPRGSIGISSSPDGPRNRR